MYAPILPDIRSFGYPPCRLFTILESRCRIVRIMEQEHSKDGPRSLRIRDTDDRWVWMGDPWHEGADGELLPPDSAVRSQSEEAVALYGNTAYRDFALTVKYRMSMAGEAKPGVVFRAVDQRLFYWVAVCFGGNRPSSEGIQDVELYRSEPTGLRTELAQHVRVAPRQWDEWYELRLVCRGTTITVYIEGVLAIVVEDDSYPSGLIGITAQGPVAFRELTVEGTSVPHTWKPPADSVLTTRVGRRIWPDLSAGEFQGWPSAVFADNGDLLVAFQLNERCFGKRSRRALLRSRDAGETWSLQEGMPPEPRVKWQAVGGGGSVGAPGLWQGGEISRLPNGELVTVGLAVDPGVDRQLIESEQIPVMAFRWLMRRSADNGYTWSEPEVMNVPRIGRPYDHSPLIPYGRIHASADGALIMTGQWIEGYMVEARGTAARQRCVVRSTDGGRSWSAPVFVDAANLLGSEADVAEVEPGKLICIMRTNTTSFAWRSWSHDGGLTWSAAEPLSFASFGQELLCTSAGILLLAHRSRGTTIHYSLDGGTSWSNAVQIDRCGGGYPRMVEMPDGRIFIVYYEGHQTPGYIRAQFVSATRDGIEPASR